MGGIEINVSKEKKKIHYLKWSLKKKINKSGLSNLFEKSTRQTSESGLLQNSCYMLLKSSLFWNQVARIQQNENSFLQHTVLTHNLSSP